MADEIDIASDMELDFQQRAIEANRKGGLKLKACGYCYNCEEPVVASRVFCSSECSEDYELRRSRKDGFQRFEGAA